MIIMTNPSWTLRVTRTDAETWEWEIDRIDPVTHHVLETRRALRPHSTHGSAVRSAMEWGHAWERDAHRRVA